jgi:hypothetical protein
MCAATQDANLMSNVLARPRSLHIPEEHISNPGDVYVALERYRRETSQSSCVCGKLVRFLQRACAIPVLVSCTAMVSSAQLRSGITRLRASYIIKRCLPESLHLNALS